MRCLKNRLGIMAGIGKDCMSELYVIKKKDPVYPIGTNGLITELDGGFDPVLCPDPDNRPYYCCHWCNEAEITEHLRGHMVPLGDDGIEYYRAKPKEELNRRGWVW